MTGGLLVVVPVIWDVPADICMGSMLAENSSAGFAHDEILVVDNSREGWGHKYGVRTHRDPDGHNLGVARSWNVGAREVLDRDLDYLVICSASMQFGPMLHCTWRWQLEQFWGETVIETDGHSWHAIAFHRRVLERVGLFDPAFWPAYVEGIDYGYRMRVLGLEHGWRHVWFNALSQGHGMHVDRTTWDAPLCPFGPLDEFYRAKWGGPKLEETWVLPYGNKPIDYIVEEPIPVLAERYGLGPRFGGWW